MNFWTPFVIDLNPEILIGWPSFILFVEHLANMIKIRLYIRPTFIALRFICSDFYLIIILFS